MSEVTKDSKDLEKAKSDKDDVNFSIEKIQKTYEDSGKDINFGKNMPLDRKNLMGTNNILGN